MLPLILLPDKILRGTTKIIPTPIDQEIKNLAKEMMLVMKHHHGIGLAAPQVNKRWRLIVISTIDGPLAYINPVIIKKSLLNSSMEEGCLSIPGIFGVVKRPKKVLVNHTTLSGNPETKWLDGLMARVYQHEVDHLDGILFIDRAIKIIGDNKLLEKYGLKK